MGRQRHRSWARSLSKNRARSTATFTVAFWRTTTRQRCRSSQHQLCGKRTTHQATTVRPRGTGRRRTFSTPSLVSPHSLQTWPRWTTASGRPLSPRFQRSVSIENSRQMLHSWCESKIPLIPIIFSSRHTDMQTDSTHVRGPTQPRLSSDPGSYHSATRTIKRNTLTETCCAHRRFYFKKHVFLGFCRECVQAPNDATRQRNQHNQHISRNRNGHFFLKKKKTHQLAQHPV